LININRSVLVVPGKSPSFLACCPVTGNSPDRVRDLEKPDFYEIKPKEEEKEEDKEEKF
jgi:hypothetical protein